MEGKKFVWNVECHLMDGSYDYRTVTTDTESWYEAEGKLLSMPDVCGIGTSMELFRPDGTRYSI